MKKLLVFLLLALATSLALVSCDFVDSQHNHKYSKTWSTTSLEHWRQASCEHTELWANKGEHTFDDGVVTKSPTEDEEGVTTYTCTVCKYTRTEPISRLVHTHKFNAEKWEYNENYHWNPSTCGHGMITTTPEPHQLFKNVCLTCDYMTESEGLTFALLSDGTYEVTGRGTNTDSCLVIPAEHNGKPVTSIGARAFYQELSKITKKVVIPSSIKTIKEYAFYEASTVSNHSNLEEVIFLGESSLEYIGDYAFYCCDSVLFKSFTIPKSVTYIGEAVFQSCISLEEILVEEGNTAYKSVDGTLYTIDGTKLLQFAAANATTEFTVPEEVTSLGVGAFSYCTYLQKVTFSESSAMTTVPKQAFYYSLELTEIALPTGITVLEEDAFHHCHKLSTLNISEGLTTIKDNAFRYCLALPEFELPSALTYIGAYAFAYCEKFTKFDVPNGVTYIGDEAFSGCTSVTSVTIPASVTRYGKKLFYGSSKLQSVTVDEANTVLRSIDGHLYTKNGKTIIYYAVANPATDFVLPTAVTTINDHAFYSCSNLESITLPSNLKKIGTDAFKLCVRLKSISIPDKVSSIGNSAFMNCSALTEINIPASLKTIPKEMLMGCNALTSIVIPETVTKIEERAFGYIPTTVMTSVIFENVDGWARHYTTDKGNFSEVISAESLADPQTAAQLITNVYHGDVWIWTDPAN